MVSVYDQYVDVRTSTYTFTPDAGLCATTTTMDITIDPAIQSTFAQLGAYCVGDTPDALLGASIEGITGTWSPAVISTASSGTSTYTFTIDAGQCALGTTMDVDITAPTTPTFTQLGPYCVTGNVDALPLVSNEGFTGTWSPDRLTTVQREHLQRYLHQPQGNVLPMTQWR